MIYPGVHGTLCLVFSWRHFRIFLSSRSSKEESLAPWIPLPPGHSNSLSTNAFSCNHNNVDTKRSAPSNACKQQTPKSKKYALPSFYSSKSKNSQLRKKDTPDLVFQHHTDLSQYMSEYRQQKLEKMLRDFNLEEKLQAARQAPDIWSPTLQPGLPSTLQTGIPSGCLDLPGNLAKVLSDPLPVYQHSSSQMDRKSERSSGSPTGLRANKP